jgi:hypothetical protein
MELKAPVPKNEANEANCAHPICTTKIVIRFGVSKLKQIGRVFPL